VVRRAVRLDTLETVPQLFDVSAVLSCPIGYSSMEGAFYQRFYLDFKRVPTDNVHGMSYVDIASADC